MSKLTKKDRIAHLEFQAAWLTGAVHELQGTENPEPQPQLKQLDQSVFDELDEKWRFAAINKAGRLMLSKSTMASDENYWHSYFAGDLYGKDTGYDASNWRNSLIARDTAKDSAEVDLSIELTGSELCKAMLARGDKYVMCMTSIGADIIDNLDCPLSSTCQFIGYLDNYSHVVPINSRGKPLTASEVGL